MTGIVCFLIGTLVGTLIRDRKYESLYVAQQKRGDHWFSRYLAASRVMQEHDLYLPNEDSPDFYG